VAAAVGASAAVLVAAAVPVRPAAVSVVLAVVLEAAAVVLLVQDVGPPRALSGAVVAGRCVGASPNAPNAKSTSRCRLRRSAG